jgi:DNA polymerase III alpha subunit
MHSNQYGQVFRNEQEVLDLMLQDPNLDISKINFESLDLVNLFNESANRCGINVSIQTANDITIDILDFDKQNQAEWFMPKDHCPNLIETLINQCNTEEQRQRVELELELYIKHGMIELLHFMKYLVDTLRKNNVVWGVGRGSSVASYILYLIGVHKVDSIKYNLDINEFLK